MIQKRRALLAALIASGSAVPAGAGCFDWLFHKHTTPVYPYAVGFAPTASVAPLAVGAPTVMQAPIVQAPGVQAPIVQGPVGQVSDMTPMGQPALGPGGYMSNFGGPRAATAAQMPAYAMMPGPINNPSVLTGMPVQAGAANTGIMGVPAASYNAAAAFQSQAPTAAMGQPLPAAGGLFGHGLLQRRNQYQTNYNSVPTTVYRPVQQLDPATGQMVIVQQPCTTTTQQVQRTPYTSLQPAQPPAVTPYYGEPACGNEPPLYQTPGQYAPQPHTMHPPQAAFPGAGNLHSGGHAPVGSGISQATAIAPTYGAPQGYASPIPSSSGATTTPLQGYPSNGAGGLTRPGDAAPVEQPRLESARPSLSPPVISSPAPPSPQYGQNQNGATYRTHEPVADPADAWQHRETWQQREPSVNPSPRPTAGTQRAYSELPPIPAADDYRPPAWQTDPGNDAPGPAQPERPQFHPRPVSPPSLQDRTVARPPQESFDRDRGDQAARYASQREPQHQVKPPAETPRDDSGWFALP